jgi:hypothetical protein
MKLDPQDIEAIAIRMAEILITRLPSITAHFAKNNGPKLKPWNDAEYLAAERKDSKAANEYLRTHERPPRTNG